MKNILVILEQECEPKIALSKAIEIAAKYHANLHVVACCSYEDSWLNAVVGMKPMRDIKTQVLEHTEKWVSDYIKQSSNELSVSYEVLWAEDFIDAVLNVSKKHRSDVIVKTGRRSEKLFYTPSDYRLMRDSKVPVYIVQETTHEDSETILIALDLLSESETKQMLNRKLLKIGSEAAARRDLKVKCCYSIDIPVVLKDLDLINTEEFVAEKTNNAKQVGEALLAEFDLPADALLLGVGKPDKTINKFAAKHKAAMIFVGSVSNKGIKAALIGNKSEQVLASAQHDLVVVSPD